MAAGSEFPSMGATIFVGLTATALITQGPAPTEFANPWEKLGGNGFESDPDDVAFAGFMAWSAPLQLPDARLLGKSGPQRRPDADGVPAAFTLTENARAVIIAESRNVSPLSMVFPENSAFRFAGDAAPSDRDALVMAAPAGAGDAVAVRWSQPVDVEVMAQAPGVVEFETGTAQMPLEDIPADDPVIRSLPATVPNAIDLEPAQPNLRVNIASRVTGNAVLLRFAPDRAAPVQTRFDKGATGIVLEIENDWRLIAFEDVTGWMFGAYLEPLAN